MPTDTHTRSAKKDKHAPYKPFRQFMKTIWPCPLHLTRMHGTAQRHEHRARAHCCLNSASMCGHDAMAQRERRDRQLVSDASRDFFPPETLGEFTKSMKFCSLMFVMLLTMVGLSSSSVRYAYGSPCTAQSASWRLHMMKVELGRRGVQMNGSCARSKTGGNHSH